MRRGGTERSEAERSPPLRKIPPPATTEPAKRIQLLDKRPWRQAKRLQRQTERDNVTQLSGVASFSARAKSFSPDKRHPALYSALFSAATSLRKCFFSLVGVRSDNIFEPPGLCSVKIKVPCTPSHNILLFSTCRFHRCLLDFFRALHNNSKTNFK